MSECHVWSKHPRDIDVIQAAGSDWDNEEKIICFVSSQDRRCLDFPNYRRMLDLRCHE